MRRIDGVFVGLMITGSLLVLAGIGIGSMNPLVGLSIFVVGMALIVFSYQGANARKSEDDYQKKIERAQDPNYLTQHLASIQKNIREEDTSNIKCSRCGHFGHSRKSCKSEVTVSGESIRGGSRNE